jgi:hypothetical protein
MPNFGTSFIQPDAPINVLINALAESGSHNLTSGLATLRHRFH